MLAVIFVAICFSNWFVVVLIANAFYCSYL